MRQNDKPPRKKTKTNLFAGERHFRIMHGVLRNDFKDSVVLVCWTLEALSPLRRIVKQVLGLRREDVGKRRVQNRRQRAVLTVISVPSFAAEGFGSTDVPP